ncbi:YdiU family protein [Thalassobius sp. Cn5-15]|uniref:protein adenylyltransferase SelO n=1 Tax=Thalassobius sp. Cn5-15 TaxID=2917763 RepID=UPI001EF27A8A|nr:YdiU family protein [Thalassobius sp. Cn5-15]MCG7492318.1 YdiU family protein [Thalassobius sp. Cn5-15]
MTLQIPFQNSYGTLPDRFYTRQTAEPVRAPELLAFNEGLAADLGITAGLPEEMAQVFGGNKVPEGADPLAQIYAGHQFGGFSPQLGDGRALLLGEVLKTNGQRVDIQMKGSGRTPYSRNGDGRAWLGPVLREYLLSEAFHALGIPTTRALAAVATGERVQRETGLPGAVLTRVASSHIRVGTFQYFYARRDLEGLQALYDYTRDRHYPQAETPHDLLRAVIARQIKLVVQWMGVGFIHGVMNTDNTTLSGETIDFGPAAFMDKFHPVTVYSSIDHQGRYSYDNQVNIICWNMAQLASCLVPLMSDGDAAVAAFTEIVNTMPEQIRTEWLRAFGQKIGIASATTEDEPLIGDLLRLMTQQEADFTNTFRALSEDAEIKNVSDPAAFAVWRARWRQRIAAEDAPQDLMCRVNPAVIPRNHRVEHMITAAVDGDMEPFHRLMRVLSKPYALAVADADLTAPPQPNEVVKATFCGT